VTSEPPTVMFALTRKRDGSKKDTLINIENEKDFVIHHVTKEIFPKVYDASAEMPSTADEFDVVGLTAIPSIKVKSPRVKESPIHFECELYNSMEVGDGNYGSATIIVGKVVYMHIDPTLYQNQKLDTTSITTISRLGNMSYGYAENKFDYEKGAWSISNW
jgi:flavin reductase (DIM6/NTAB) family NADH-FMN oxidoreductase RutF